MKRPPALALLAPLLLAVVACKPEPEAPAPVAEAGQDVTATAEAQAPASGIHFGALDTATRPQDDFYQFANGGWLDTTEIPQIYSGYTVYHQVYEDAGEALRKIVEHAAQNPG